MGCGVIMAVANTNQVIKNDQKTYKTIKTEQKNRSQTVTKIENGNKQNLPGNQNMQGESRRSPVNSNNSVDFVLKKSIIQKKSKDQSLEQKLDDIKQNKDQKNAQTEEKRPLQTVNNPAIKSKDNQKISPSPVEIEKNTVQKKLKNNLAEQQQIIKKEIIQKQKNQNSQNHIDQIDSKLSQREMIKPQKVTELLGQKQIKRQLNIHTSKKQQHKQTPLSRSKQANSMQNEEISPREEKIPSIKNIIGNGSGLFQANMPTKNALLPSKNALKSKKNTERCSQQSGNLTVVDNLNQIDQNLQVHAIESKPQLISVIQSGQKNEAQNIDNSIKKRAQDQRKQLSINRQAAQKERIKAEQEKKRLQELARQQRIQDEKKRLREQEKKKLKKVQNKLKKLYNI